MLISERYVSTCQANINRISDLNRFILRFESIAREIKLGVSTMSPIKSHLITAAIGPNISSFATRIDSVTSEMTAGSTKKPDALPFFSLPPRNSTKHCPHIRVNILVRTSQNLRSFLSGIGNEINDALVLILVNHGSKVCSVVQSTANDLFFRFLGKFSQEFIIDALDRTTRSRQHRRYPRMSTLTSCTRNRLAHTHVCPDARNFDAMAPCTACFTSAELKTMNGALPPSSSDSFLMVDAHMAMIFFPTSARERRLCNTTSPTLVRTRSGERHFRNQWMFTEESAHLRRMGTC